MRLVTGRGRLHSSNSTSPFWGGLAAGTPASRDLGKRVLRKPLQSGRACSPAHAAPEPGEVAARGAAGEGAEQLQGWGGADAPMGADEGSAGKCEKGERLPGCT